MLSESTSLILMGYSLVYNATDVILMDSVHIHTTLMVALVTELS